MVNKKDIEVAIIGGGISGLALAAALHHRGLPFTIYEQAAAFGEIGAGVSFSPNAVHAMKICHPGVLAGFERVCTRNVWPSKRNVWFDYYDGVREPPSSEPAFSITNELGQNALHRARFLDELVKLVPDETTRFKKKLTSLKRDEGGKWAMNFADGSTATADVVIGCDGIKSMVRRLLVGEDHPSAMPTYSHKYAYRALAPMEDAIKAVGKEKAQNSCMFMGPDSHVLTFPVNHGKTLNIVAMHTSEADWEDYDRTTKSARREDALRDFAGFNSDVRNLLELTEENLDVWALFHLGDHPVPTCARDGICLIGDAAHATTPHHGAGAGMCIEDAAVLAELLALEQVHSREHFETAFDVFDAVRRERGQWLVQSSRHIGDCYEWRAEGIDGDLAKIEADINHRNGIIGNADVRKLCDDARSELGERLASAKT